MEKEKLVNGFKRIFKDGGDIRGYFAPGRVNLIGEHIDYNGGHVFPCALKNGNYVVARRREDKKIRFFSENFRRKAVLTSSLEDLSFKKEDLWTNYPKGVFYEFQKKGLSIPNGFDIYVSGDIPGSGLSSSAAMEIVIGTMLEEQFGFGLTPIEIALLGQKSENEYNGCSCGIMDQFASAMGKEGQAIFLDCKNLSYQYVPLSLKDYVIVVTNSNKPHSLTQSHYNDRRKECEEALQELQKSIPVSSLCETDSRAVLSLRGDSLLSCS
jgi:galactokinase